MTRRHVQPGLLLILLAACALRVFNLGAQELRGDETFGYFFQQSSLAGIVQDTIANREPHPVASYFVQKAWLAAAGHSEFALRFSSAWFSILAVALIYRLARRLGLTRATAILAAALLAASPYMIWHSQDARMYSMLLALGTASSWLALEALGRRQPRYWIAYVAVSWLALHTHYSAAFILVAQNLAVFGRALQAREAGGLRSWIASQAALAVLYAPWLWLAGSNLAAYSGNGESPGLPAMVYRSFSALAVGQAIPEGLQPWLGALAALVVIWGMVELSRSRRWPAADLWLILGLLVPLGATWASALNRPIFNERYLVAAVPAFCLLLAAGLALPIGRLGVSWTALAQRRGRAVAGAAPSFLALGALLVLAAGAVGGLANHYANPDYSKTHGWRALAVALQQLAQPLPAKEVRVAENYPDPTLWYYYDAPVEHLMLPPAADDAQGARAAVAQLMAQGVHWVLLPVLPAESWDPTGSASAALAEHYRLIDRRQAGSWPLEVYMRPDPATLPQINVTFANGLVLERGGCAPANPTPGGLLAVSLAWRADTAQLRGTEKLFIHVTDSQGAPQAQSDTPLDAAALHGIQSYGIPLPSNLAPGRYEVVAGLYDPGQAGAPRVPAAGGADHVALGEVTVTPGPGR